MKRRQIFVLKKKKKHQTAHSWIAHGSSSHILFSYVLWILPQVLQKTHSHNPYYFVSLT